MQKKFAGALYTTTIEAFIDSSGRAIQAATSHSLGQNFSRAFDIEFESRNENETTKEFAWQNSWGLSTLSIGIMIMMHGDDKGIILPPRVAPVQIVIVPIKNKKKNMELVEKAAEDLKHLLKQGDLRVELDDRNNYKPGFKYNYWELRGVPIRIELGGNDIKKKWSYNCKKR